MARFKGIQAALWKALLVVTYFPFRILSVQRTRAQLRLARSRFEIRPDDIFISTSPKSGTTLMQMLLYQLTTDGRMDFPHINAVCPWFEAALQKHRLQGLSRLPSPRCFKTHLAAGELPVERGRYICILRDLRDVIVSSYHHNRLIDGLDQSLEQMTEGFLKTQPYNPLRPTWFDHLESWWGLRNRPNVLFLSYEAMVADLEGTVRRVADFLGIAVHEGDMPRILERCSFEFMKRHEAQFDPRLQWGGHDTPGFLRQGKAGSSRDLTPRHQELLEKRLSALAQKLGCGSGEPYREMVEALAPPSRVQT